MITLEETQAAMDGLTIAGRVPNGKLAYWAASLSPRNRLDHNMFQVGVMRAYVNRPLPLNRDELRAQLGACMVRTLNTLYEVERLWNDGTIHFDAGYTFESQAQWRDLMASAIPGMGMKCVSFALQIYAPNVCKLLTIDIWHLKRLGYTSPSITRKQYLQAEQQLQFDCALLKLEEGNGTDYSAVILSACWWFRSRGGMPEAHDGLSCYV